MDFATLLFWILAIVMVVAALAVVTMRNIVHSAMALFFMFALAAGVYVLARAEFIAIVQILIYGGAITVLILFALMLTRIGGQRRTNPTNRTWPVALLVCLLVGGSILYALLSSPLAVSQTLPASVPMDPLNNVARIGLLLYSPSQYSYVLPFEIASIVLLVAIVGAIVIGRED
ncbi:NADH dehydrogenase subunit J [Thermosporothrix hazakensis]|uniref:NADH-quinone oxidoreductase subunit J n=2 Tax=Thermosporothrix TaxID=768650 RepID=A0A326UFF6_THEHA|nr:NADH-quinone oxidoreductase subunit J [Thermosporothrix hazakensis]PZW36635.1 NADH dehydrogenase subunit J [Thermosporothrix hazakensis]GCE47286.1 NADH-quinone oxidoreductase subunit J [Thermosporothrix hazakensis]